MKAIDGRRHRHCPSLCFKPEGNGRLDPQCFLGSVAPAEGNRDPESALSPSSPAGSPGHPGGSDENAGVIGMSHVASYE